MQLQKETIPDKPVPIFLERFILPVFSGAVVVIAVANPMRWDPIQRTSGAGFIICLALFVSHTVQLRASAKIIESSSQQQSNPQKPDTQQPSPPQKPSPSPPVQQNSRGANSPNTNIIGNNNTVTNTITIKEPPPQPPKLRFKDQSALVYFSSRVHQRRPRPSPLQSPICNIHRGSRHSIFRVRLVRTLRFRCQTEIRCS